MSNDYLYHYGVPGMKWGIRRTPAQLGRTTSSTKKKSTSKSLSTFKRKKKPAKPVVQKPVKKKLKDMSDDEIREKVQRLKLEKEFKSLEREVRASETSKGKKFVMDVLEMAGKDVATQTTKYLMSGGINQIAKAIGIKNGTVVLKSKDGKPLIDDDGFEKTVKVFKDIVDAEKWPSKK